jgi:hypothetical protein
MTKHDLTRDSANQPVCVCGYRPDILNQTSPVGIQWKAKADVLNHVEAERLLELKAIHAPARRSPLDPFQASTELKYPRAGVRQTPAGEWLLSCWDADRIVHVIDEPVFADRVAAFDYGYLAIGACRQSGTNLNGWATT